MKGSRAIYSRRRTSYPSLPVGPLNSLLNTLATASHVSTTLVRRKWPKNFHNALLVYPRSVSRRGGIWPSRSALYMVLVTTRCVGKREARRDRGDNERGRSSGCSILNMY